MTGDFLPPGGNASQSGKDGPNLVHDPPLFGDQVPPLAVRPLARSSSAIGIASMLLNGASRSAASRERPAPSVPCQGDRSLPADFARHREARGVDDMLADSSVT
jgi:hypothetical protein